MVVKREGELNFNDFSFIFVSWELAKNHCLCTERKKILPENSNIEVLGLTLTSPSPISPLTNYIHPQAHQTNMIIIIIIIIILILIQNQHLLNKFG
jgi:hypothetical protein